MSWRKSTYSGGGDGDACVEISESRTHISIRDSKEPARATLTVPARSFVAFTEALKRGPWPES